MNALQTLRINTPTVISEVFEHEIVMLHLESGAYYSLEQSGAEIWTVLQQGANLPEITARVAALYGINAEEIESTVHQFMQELAQEQLIVPDSAAAPSSRSQGAKVACASRGNHHGFTPPYLNKYTDMQDLLLLDPIHEVAESGWPHVKPQ